MTESLVMSNSSQGSEMTSHEDFPEASTSGLATIAPSNVQTSPVHSTQKSTSVGKAATLTPGSPGKRTSPMPVPMRTSSRSNRGVPPPHYGVDE